MTDKLIEIWQIVVSKLLVHRKTLALLLGVLLAFALPPFNQIWALFVSFSMVMFLCCQTNSLKKLAAQGYFFGFGFFSVGFYWIGNALLVDPVKTGWLYPITLFLNGAFFGLFTIAPFMMSKLGKNTVAKIILFAATWCLVTEWFRGFFLTGFPWNPISSAVSFSPAMLQTLTIWGTYGLSLVLIILAAWPVFWILNPSKKTAFIAVLSLVTMDLLWEYGLYVLVNRPHVQDGNSIMVRLVQPSIPQSLKWDRDVAEQNLQKYIELSKGSDNHYIDFTVWGETASPFDLTYDSAHVAKIRKAIPKNGYLVTGFLRREIGATAAEDALYNSLAVINRKGLVLDTYDKSHLVPFGEYIPLRQYLPNWLQPIANSVGQFGNGMQYQTINIEGYPEFAPLICYEIIFSGQVIRKENKPKWMIVLTNDGWYGNSAGPYQHLAAAQMRAVEEGISIVRSANSGISAVITPYGMIKSRLELGKEGFLDVVVKPDTARETIFGKYGNTIPVFMSLSLILLVLLFSARRRED